MSTEFYKSFPKKSMAAGALILDNHGQILVVKPTYKNYWHIPGGVIELNESPLSACKREVSEEIALHLDIKKLLVIDYKETTMNAPESLVFIFYGGMLDDEAINHIRLPAEELEDFKFICPNEAYNYLSSSMAARIIHSLDVLKHDSIMYLENQTIIT